MNSAYSTETPAKVAKVAAASRNRAASAPTQAQQPTSVLTHDLLPGIEITLEPITPELAEHYLHRRPGATSDIKQRNISKSLVDRYADDMRNEKWPFTGNPIQFNTLGELINGQHRLEAIEQSRSTEMMIVIRGLLPDTFAVFDTGRARSFTDVLTSKGIASVSMAAGITRRVFYWRRGNYGVPHIGRVPNPPFLGMPASPSMLLDTFDTFRPEIQAAGRRGAALKASGFAPKTAAPAVIGFVYLVLSRLDLDQTEAFFHELQIGPAQVGPEYPIAVLRNRLLRHVSSSESASPDWVWIHFFFHTWNKWFKAESMGALKTPPRAAFGYVAKPIDPHAADRPAGWEPLGGVTA